MAGYRDAAITALNKFFTGEIAYLSEERDRVFSENEIPEQNEAIFNEVLYGVVRRYRSLDSVIDTYSDYGLSQLQKDVHEALRLGLYEILFLDSVPEPVAVNEYVSIIKDRQGKRSGNFVNGVLRETLRELTAETWDFPKNLENLGSAHLFPVRDGRCREFMSPVFPQPDENQSTFVRYLSRAFNYPEWICKEWVRAYGQEESLNIARLQSERPPLFVRGNTSEAGTAKLKSLLTRENLPWTESSVPGFYRIDKWVRPEDIPGFENGRFTVQDARMGSLLQKLDVGKEDVILDMCAAPGGKSTHLAEQTGNRTPIYAVDAHRKRIRRVRENRDRLHLDAVRPICGDGRYPPFERNTFDRIVLDVPCTNTGVLGRRVEARYHLEEGLDAQLLELQEELLHASLECLAPGGKLLYTSCSLLPEENEQLLSEALVDYSDLRMEKPSIAFPTEEIPSGGFATVIARSGSEND